jgi:hypothetical protein
MMVEVPVLPEGIVALAAVSVKLLGTLLTVKVTLPLEDA